MQVEVNRSFINPPPVSSVVLYLSPDEANVLCLLFGRLGRGAIMKLISDDELANNAYDLTGTLYKELAKEGLGVL